MSGRIVVFGATGYTGRMTAQRLVAAGADVVLAGRSEDRLRALSERLGGLEWRRADILRQNSVFSLVGEGDVLLSTVGPFAKWGEPAVRAAIAAPATYIDSTGEPAFIRRVFEEFSAPAERAGAALLTAMGYDFVPGALAGALALDEAGDEAVRVDLGYYSLGAASMSRGTSASLAGAAIERQFAWRGGRLVGARPAERVRTFAVRGRGRDAISIGGAEHFTLPATYPRLQEVNVYLGWFAGLARPFQAGTLVSSYATRLPGVKTVMGAVGERIAAVIGSDDPDTDGVSWVVGEAYSASGERLAVVELSGASGYPFTFDFLAWAARRAASGTGVAGLGALGPVEAFGLEALEAGCAAAGLSRVG